MYERCTTADGGRHVNRLGHLLGVDSVLETGFGECVNAVGALNGVCDPEGDEGLFPFAEGALGEDCRVPRAELLPQGAGLLADFSEAGEIFGISSGPSS